MDLAPGDKVMQIENDYDKEVYNGDIGYIDDVDPETGELKASFDGRSVIYGFRRAGHAGPGLCRHYPEEPRFGISSRRYPGPDPALPDAAAKSALHWRHARQATGGYRRPEESRRDRRSQHFWPAPMVEARRMASRRRARRTDEFVEGRLKPDEFTFGPRFLGSIREPRSENL